MIINKTQVTTMMTGRCENMRDAGKSSEEVETDCDTMSNTFVTAFINLQSVNVSL